MGLRVVFGAYLARYPLAGMMSGMVEFAASFASAGHDVWIVERAAYENACYDPKLGSMTDDPTLGISLARTLLDRFGLRDRFAFVDVSGQHFGLSERQLADVFDSADLFVDYGVHGAFADLAAQSGARMLIDGEPGYTQILMEQGAGNRADYDHYFTFGQNIGTSHSTAPTAGRSWSHTFHPVNVSHFEPRRPPPDAPFTSVMNWQSHREIVWNDVAYGQKDREFPRFESLPTAVSAPLEVAVAGRSVPVERLRGLGWSVVDGHEVTSTYEGFRRYIERSSGEFSVAKHVFVALNTGWFSDRNAAFLASGRPVVLQNTGWDRHLPTGEGLFAVRDADEAAAAIEAICVDWDRHSRAAREIASEFLDAARVIPKLIAAVDG